MKRYFALIVVASLLVSFFNITFASSDPVATVQQTSDNVIKKLQSSKNEINKDPKAVYKIVQQVILPSVDVPYMSRLVLGRNNWQSATPQQRRDFSEEFVKLLTRTYASAFTDYTDETVTVYPMRGTPTSDRTQVKTKIIRSNGPAIPVDYRMINDGGQWKVYDFSVEGISMIQSFRSQFAAELSHGGMDNLISRLQNHNRAGGL